MQLRPYQVAALASLSDSFRRGRRAPLLVAPTGAGKTAMATAMCVKHLARSPSNQVAWAAHRTELIDQAKATLAKCGVDMQRASVFSIQGAVASRKVPPATLVIQDEAHHQASDEWSFLNTAWPNAHRVGLTATPERGDGRGLRVAFDDIVVAATPAQLIELGFLVPCRTQRPPKLLRSGQVAQRPVDAYLEHANGRKAVVFCQHVKAANEHLEEFRAAGIRAAVVTAKTPWPERAATIEAFRDGRGQVLLNVHVLTEGFDAPETSCCIIARGCGTAGLFIQMVGRAIRCAPGKTDAVLIDLRGVSWIHGFVDDEREYSLDGKGIRAKSEPGARFCLVCGAVLGPQPGCPECGRMPAPLELPKVTHDPLEEARRRANEPDEAKVGKLAYWIRTGRVLGHQPIAAFMKYKGFYGSYPTDKIQREALKRA